MYGVHCTLASLRKALVSEIYDSRAVCDTSRGVPLRTVARANPHFDTNTSFR